MSACAPAHGWRSEDNCCELVFSYRGFQELNLVHQTRVANIFTWLNHLPSPDNVFNCSPGDDECRGICYSYSVAEIS